MELSTFGHNFYPEMVVPLWHQPQETFAPIAGVETRFRLVLVEEGTGILRLGELREAFFAPAIFCLNEKESPELEQAVRLKAQAFYFHPAIINHAFNFETVRGGKGFDQTDWHDQYWLRAFIERKPGQGLQLCLGPLAARRAASLFTATTKELADQRDWNWPCRTRSYFLELLFLVDHLFYPVNDVERPAAAETSPIPVSRPLPLARRDDEMSPILLYLHANYQDKITLTDLTRRFNINRTTLTERFNQATGSPVMSYLIQLRVRVAALMLRDTSLPIAEIGERVGFRDITHFGRTFRKLTGYTPADYRQRYCWMV
jgi:AraC family L-rhamnose operon regulatory protein RhaS